MVNGDMAPYTLIKIASLSHKSALHFACFYGHLNLVYFLFCFFNNCEINVFEDEKCTPLMKVDSNSVMI